MLVLRHLTRRTRRYRFVDTHAGAGGYSLLGRYAKKKGEYERGIGLLWTRDDLPAPLADYVALVRALQSRRRARPVPRLARARADAAAPAGRAARVRAPSDRAEDPARDARRRPPRDRLRRRRLRRPARAGAAAVAPRRGADRSELRGQRRLRQGRRQRCARRWRASPRASTSSGIRRSARSRRRSCRAGSTALAPKGWLHARLIGAGARRAGLRPGRQRRVRHQPAAHAARDAGGDAALSGRRPRPVRRAPTS